jgi:hypothetical protein
MTEMTVSQAVLPIATLANVASPQDIVNMFLQQLIEERERRASEQIAKREELAKQIRELLAKDCEAWMDAVQVEIDAVVEDLGEMGFPSRPVKLVVPKQSCDSGVFPFYCDHWVQAVEDATKNRDRRSAKKRVFQGFAWWAAEIYRNAGLAPHDFMRDDGRYIEIRFEGGRLQFTPRTPAVARDETKQAVKAHGGITVLPRLTDNEIGQAERKIRAEITKLQVSGSSMDTIVKVVQERLAVVLL